MSETDITPNVSWCFTHNNLDSVCYLGAPHICVSRVVLLEDNDGTITDDEGFEFRDEPWPHPQESHP